MKYGKKILIVDDSLWIIERLLYMLEDLPNIAETSYAMSYEETAASLRKAQPDVLFLDINLPGINGIEMLKRFRKLYPAMKIIMFTVHTDSFYRAFCKNLGADYFINKSEDFELIPQVIAEITEDTAIPVL